MLNPSSSSSKKLTKCENLNFIPVDLQKMLIPSTSSSKKITKCENPNFIPVDLQKMLNPSSSSSKKLNKCENPNFIPVEIIEEILKRLPVKSLSRFKCVSKPWLDLISSPRFVKIHLLSYSPNFQRMMFLCGEDLNKHVKHSLLASFMSDEPTIDHIDYPENYLTIHSRLAYVVGSCNGLVCLAINPDLFIWNPSTRLYKKIPPYINIDEVDDDWQCSDCSFVYNAVDDDYKVMYLYIKTGELQVDVYSLRANSWVTRVSINSNITSFGEQMIFDGRILIGLDDEADPSVELDMLSWDLESEVYSAIELPDYGEAVESIVMRELGGCFCVVCGTETHADFWVMKEFGVKESWTKILTVYFADPFHGDTIITPLVLPSGEILVTFRDPVSRFEVYNLKDKSMRLLDATDLGEFIEAYIYVESLVSPTQHE